MFQAGNGPRVGANGTGSSVMGSVNVALKPESGRERDRGGGGSPAAAAVPGESNMEREIHVRTVVVMGCG